MINSQVGHKIKRDVAEFPNQTRDAWHGDNVHSLQTLDSMKHNLDFYEWIRANIPFLDIGIYKKMQLIGFPTVRSDNPAEQEIIDYLTKKVPCNYFEKGLREAMRQSLDASFEAGVGVFEYIPYRDMSGIARLKNARTKHIDYIPDENGRMLVAQRAPMGVHSEPFEHQERIFQIAFDRRQGNPRGYSLFYSLPFVAQIFMRIMKTVDHQLYRVGDPTFFFVLEGVGEDINDYALAKKYQNDLKGQVSVAMEQRQMGRLSDVFGVTPSGAKLTMKALGQDIEIMSLEVPIKIILEQIIGKLGLPPHTFGVHWQATYDLTEAEGDMLVQGIKEYREGSIDPIIDELYGRELAMHGYANSNFTWEWEDVTLLDSEKQSKAKYLDQLSMEKMITNQANLVTFGFIEVSEAVDNLIRDGILGDKKFEKADEDRVKAMIFNRIADMKVSNAINAKELVGEF
jgi:hypothetical protein